jgi:hypothetical protein
MAYWKVEREALLAGGVGKSSRTKIVPATDPRKAQKLGTPGDSEAGVDCELPTEDGEVV